MNSNLLKICLLEFILITGYVFYLALPPDMGIAIIIILPTIVILNLFMFVILIIFDKTKKLAIDFGTMTALSIPITVFAFGLWGSYSNYITYESYRFSFQKKHYRLSLQKKESGFDIMEVSSNSEAGVYSGNYIRSNDTIHLNCKYVKVNKPLYIYKNSLYNFLDTEKLVSLE